MAFPFTLAAGASKLALSIVQARRRRAEEDRRRRQAFADAELARDREDVAAAPRQYVVGTAMTSGVVVQALDSEITTLGAGKHRYRRVHSITLLSGAPLAAVTEAWIANRLAPLVAAAGQTDPVRVWATKGWTLAKTVRAYRYYDLTGVGPLRARFEDVRTRMDALVPGWRPSTEGDPLVIPDDINAVTLALFDDLLAEYNALLTSAAFLDWQDRRITQVGSTTAPLNEPAVTIRLSLGDDSDALPTSDVQTYARTWLPNWKSSDTGKGMAWALNTLRFWQDERGRIRPWSATPTIRYLCTGKGDFDGNPAKLARAIYKSAGRTDADLAGVQDAIDYCAALLTIPTMPALSLEATTEGLRLKWSDYREHLWPDADYPPPTEEARVRAEVNARIAGIQNAKARYGLNAVITSSQIDSGEALDMCAERMGGSFVELSGKRIGFRPARPGSASFTSTPRTRTQGATIRMGGDASTPNTLVARIEQDSDRQHRASTTPKSTLATLVERDGEAMATRTARGVATQIEAMRQNAFMLDVGSPDKRLIEWAEIVTGPADPRGLAAPGDLADYQTADGTTTTVRIVSVQPQLARTVYVGREVDEDWADDKYFPTPVNRDPPPSGGGELDLWGNMQYRWRDAETGRVCDFTLWVGHDVAQIEIGATWRERTPSTPPLADEVRRYLIDVPTDHGGAPFVHTLADQAETDPLTVVEAGADAWTFDDPTRELVLTIRPKNADDSGPDLGGILLLPDHDPRSVVLLGAKETRIGSGATFEGWLWTASGIVVREGGRLQLSWDAGDTWTTPPHYQTTIPNGVNIATTDASTTDASRRFLVIKNTFDLEPGQNTLTLAHNFGTDDDPDHGPPLEFELSKYVQPGDDMFEVTSKPTTDGKFTGQLAYEVEDE